VVRAVRGRRAGSEAARRAVPRDRASGPLAARIEDVQKVLTVMMLMEPHRTVSVAHRHRHREPTSTSTSASASAQGGIGGIGGLPATARRPSGLGICGPSRFGRSIAASAVLASGSPGLPGLVSRRHLLLFERFWQVVASVIERGAHHGDQAAGLTSTTVVQPAVISPPAADTHAADTYVATTAALASTSRPAVRLAAAVRRRYSRGRSPRR